MNDVGGRNQRNERLSFRSTTNETQRDNADLNSIYILLFWPAYTPLKNSLHRFCAPNGDHINSPLVSAARQNDRGWWRDKLPIRLGADERFAQIATHIYAIDLAPTLCSGACAFCGHNTTHKAYIGHAGRACDELRNHRQPSSPHEVMPLHVVLFCAGFVCVLRFIQQRCHLDVLYINDRLWWTVRGPRERRMCVFPHNIENVLPFERLWHVQSRRRPQEIHEFRCTSSKRQRAPTDHHLMCAQWQFMHVPIWCVVPKTEFQFFAGVFARISR